MHRFLLHNDSIVDTREKILSAGQVGFMNGWGVFSTIRVAAGVLFAFERHLARMQHDAVRMHVPFPADTDQFKSRLLQLVEANLAADSTLRVAVVRNHGGLFEAPDLTRDFEVLAFTCDLNSWGDSARLSIKPHARHAQGEFAGAKINSWAQNLTWYEEAHQRGFDEVVLLNERGEVSECTSANIFAVSGREAWTPPLTSGCLPGVTRALLLEEIRVPRVSVIEKTILPHDLQRADEIFITSTTRDLLPISHIEGLQLNTNRHVVRSELSRAFEAFRLDYVQRHTAAVDKVSA